MADRIDELFAHAQDLPDDERVELANRLSRLASDLLPWGKDHPVSRVQWVKTEGVTANDYNPNSVAHHEMRLLHISITEDGYTQPVVAVWDPDQNAYVIVDGFHRYTILRRYPDVLASTHGYCPVVVIDSSPADRMASTIRHNRARGKHSVAGMGNLVFEMLQEGVSDADICNKLGLEPEELARLKHVTGFSKLFKDVNYTPQSLTAAQLTARADYRAEHPDEPIPEYT